MKRSRLLGLTLVAVFALGAMLAASASALPEALSSSKSATTKLDSGAAILETSAGTKVECGAANGTSGEVSSTSETFKANFERCEVNVLGIHKCSGPGDATEGVILAEGSVHFVFDTLGGTLGVAILFSPKEIEFNCTSLAKSEVKGSLLCLILETLVSSVTHLFHCSAGAGSGVPSEKAYSLDNGSPATVLLLTELNGGGFQETNMQTLAASSTALTGVWMNE